MADTLHLKNGKNEVVLHNAKEKTILSLVRTFLGDDAELYLSEILQELHDEIDWQRDEIEELKRKIEELKDELFKLPYT